MRIGGWGTAVCDCGVLNADCGVGKRPFRPTIYTRKLAIADFGLRNVAWETAVSRINKKRRRILRDAVCLGVYFYFPISVSIMSRISRR